MKKRTKPVNNQDVAKANKRLLDKAGYMGGMHVVVVHKTKGCDDLGSELLAVVEYYPAAAYVVNEYLNEYLQDLSK